MPTRSVRQTDAEAIVLLISGAEEAGPMILADLALALPAAPRLIAAEGGKAALALLREETPDLVLAQISSLADLGDPVEEAVARVVKHAGGALLIVLAEGASVSATLAVMGAGAHECLAKPIEAGDLGPRVVELARRHKKSRALTGEAPQVEAHSPFADALAEMQQAYQHLTRLAAAQDPGTPGHNAAAPRRPVMPMWQQEQRIIEDAIAAFGGNVALAAAALEISPSTIYRKRQNWADSEQVA